jgi:hypothetical protein
LSEGPRRATARFEMSYPNSRNPSPRGESPEAARYRRNKKNGGASQAENKNRERTAARGWKKTKVPTLARVRPDRNWAGPLRMREKSTAES